MPRIAISYRRSDSAGVSVRVFDRRAAHFGHENVFMGIDAIRFGVDFRKNIDRIFQKCDVVLVVIGPRWFGADPQGRRIEQACDPVHVEVLAALSRDNAVIPLLVDGAAMPNVSDLPTPLHELAYRNAAIVDIGRVVHIHLDRLIRSIARSAGVSPFPKMIQPRPRPLTSVPIRRVMLKSDASILTSCRRRLSLPAIAAGHRCRPSLPAIAADENFG